MRGLSMIIVSSALLSVGCATREPAAGPEPPAVDASGLVRVAYGEDSGSMYAHPTHSIDHYDDILVGEISVSYAPGEPALAEGDAQRLRMKTYDVVTRQIPAVGQLLAGDSGPCTVELGVELSALDFPEPASREKGACVLRGSQKRRKYQQLPAHWGMVLGSRRTGSPVSGSIVSIHEGTRASGGSNSPEGRKSSSSGSSTGRSCSGTSRVLPSARCRRVCTGVTTSLHASRYSVADGFSVDDVRLQFSLKFTFGHRFSGAP